MGAFSAPLCFKHPARWSLDGRQSSIHSPCCARSYSVYMARFQIAFLLLFSGATLTLAAQQALADSHPASISSTTQQTAITTDGLSCGNFEWRSSSLSDKSVMLVPISINGKQFIYQLDTGADVLMPYGAAMEKGWSPLGKAVRIPDVRFAGMAFSSVKGFPAKEMPVSQDPKDPQGTVGLELLLGKTFVIDFPRQRVCLLERADLPERLDQAADWTPAEVRHGKLFVNLELNSKKLDGIHYDTGSSLYTLDTSLSLWQEATGKSGTKDATTHFSICCAWGHPLEGIGAPASGDLKIGNHVYPKPMLTTEIADPDSSWYQSTLGNALFTQSIVILDLGAHPRFGVIDSSRP
jgi:hypothetical protein